MFDRNTMIWAAVVLHNISFALLLKRPRKNWTHFLLFHLLVAVTDQEMKECTEQRR